ncbi:MAG TPA: TAXI family TRAP transporter solute-binding subunit, partial [Xanthobacteraceae bacterium]|nr:TAXI family TRAP transporter solute-binding subunit [Xanthobacteraceae bacterium]
MPPRLRKRPLAMKLWLAQRFGFGRAAQTEVAAAAGHARTTNKPMSIESLELMVRNRVRMFLRHTWLVTILGTVIIGGAVWTVFYSMTAPTAMRIAAGPIGSADAKLVQVMAQLFAADRDKVRLALVATAGPRESQQAIVTGGADLAILPSTLGNSLDWPVVAIVRQNVMALIVPAAAAPTPVANTGKQAAIPEKKESGAPEKKEKSGKHGKATKGAAARAAKSAKENKNTKVAKGEDDESGGKSGGSDPGNTDTVDTVDSNKLAKVAQLAGHRIGIVTGNAATKDLLNLVLNHYGVAPDKVQVSQIDPENLAEAVKANQVDAIFVAGSITGKAISDAAAAASHNGNAPSFIAIDHADGIAKRNPAFDSVDIDAGTFGGNPPAPDDSFKSLSFPEY